ncbi:MAG: helix-turn-helix transcriptional regulator [Nitrospirae bacterium]|nr:helix-turn-helix transcriptional regulator [Nitrospirota bacterium]
MGYEACTGECPVERTLKIIGSKWTILIIRDLLEGKKRFGELRKSLSGVSPKTLSGRLKSLESEGIIARRIYPEVPPRVEYALTKRGTSLGAIIKSMKEWGKTAK